MTAFLHGGWGTHTVHGCPGLHMHTRSLYYSRRYCRYVMLCTVTEESMQHKASEHTVLNYVPYSAVLI